MKRILITGADSYIGTSVEKWLLDSGGNYEIHTLDMKNRTWKEYSFEGYDVVFHVAGLAHISTDKGMKDKYFEVNRDLAVETAEIARESGVKQFIFMSSIIVYGNSGRMGEERRITAETVENPADFYGMSKLAAEKGLLLLENEQFHVAIIRPPMIYGKGSKGNYPRLAKLAQKSPVFPDVNNCRSMLFIDNLCEFVRLLIENESRGIFYPQNKEYVKTSQMVKQIALCHNKKIYLTKLFNVFLYLGGKKINIVNKVFGNMTYEKQMSSYWNFRYCMVDFEESIRRTEGC